jgi:hypothetical protein
MGTHARLGVESVVRSISGQHDALRLIAKHAGMRTTAWLPQPPAIEVLVLRKSVHREHGLAFDLQQQVDALLVENNALEKSNERLLRQVESVEQRMQEVMRSCERRLTGEAAYVQVNPAPHRTTLPAPPRHDLPRPAPPRPAPHRIAPLPAMQEVKRSAAVFKATLSRQHTKELSDLEAKSQRVIDQMEADCVHKLEAMSGDRRDDLVRLASARTEAEREAAAFERQFQEQQVLTTRLRSARNQSSLERMIELEEKLRIATKRRGANQLKVSDANLARHATSVAQQQLQQEREQLRSFWGEGIDLAARSKQLEAKNAKLLAQLAFVQQELKEQQADTVKYKAVAEPGKGRFYESAHFSAIVDRACIESLSLGVSRNKVPHLFLIFARLFGIKLPGRMEKVPGPRVDGKRATVERFVLYTPGAGHVKEMAAVMNQLNKLQVRVLPHTLL